MNEELQSQSNGTRVFIAIAVLVIGIGGGTYFYVNRGVDNNGSPLREEAKKQQASPQDKGTPLESLIPKKSEKSDDANEDEVPVIPQPILNQKNESISLSEEELKEGLSDQKMPTSQAKTYPLTINTTPIEAELAETKEQQERGLGGRKDMPDDYGLLYILPKPYFYDFWMKDMKFPIDIIWVDRNQNVVDITRNLSPDSYPRIFQPVRPAQFVIEVVAGFADKHGIKIGDPVTIPKIQ